MTRCSPATRSPEGSERRFRPAEWRDSFHRSPRLTREIPRSSERPSTRQRSGGRARRQAHQRRRDHSRRRGLRADRMLRPVDRDAAHGRAGGGRDPVLVLPYHGAVLADARGPYSPDATIAATAWAASPSRCSATPATTGSCRRRTGCCRRYCRARDTTPSRSGSGISSRTTSSQGDRVDHAGPATARLRHGRRSP